jgi:hypothetical protein
MLRNFGTSCVKTVLWALVRKNSSSISLAQHFKKNRVLGVLICFKNGLQAFLFYTIYFQRCVNSVLYTSF